MRIDTNRGELLPRSLKILIAIPTYDGNVCYQCVGSLIQTISLLEKRGVHCDVRFASHMIIQVARNALTKEFLSGDYTHILFIDSDQGWDENKIYEITLMNQEFVAAAICHKNDEEEYPLLLDVEFDGSLKYGPHKLVKAYRIGVALALISRSAFEKIDAYHVLPRSEKYGKEYFAFYIKGSEYQGEDNDFCDKLRKANVDMWIYPNIDIKHIGPKEYKANFDMFLRKLPGGDLSKEKPREYNLNSVRQRIENAIDLMGDKKNV